MQWSSVTCWAVTNLLGMLKNHTFIIITHTHRLSSVHAHTRTPKCVNALTQTRESPTVRLFRGITWLLSNSVALPWRPFYFRLLYLFSYEFAFLSASLSFCESVELLENVPLCFYAAHISLHFTYSVCVCVYYCEWSAGEVMWVDVVRQGH